MFEAVVKSVNDPAPLDDTKVTLVLPQAFGAVTQSGELVWENKFECPIRKQIIRMEKYLLSKRMIIGLLNYGSNQILYCFANFHTLYGHSYRKQHCMKEFFC